ncbi:Eco57I restriction-modification methylase domain-containing protein [Chloroflexota bacterium]
MVGLRTELDLYLAAEYGIDLRKPSDFERWHSSHQPFHWFVEFYGIMNDGGFDAIIGNPPYVEYSKIKGAYTVQNYRTLKCGNLYPFVVERSLDILHLTGRFGLILQMSSISTDRMETLQNVILEKNDKIWCSTYAERPSKLFEGVETQLAIIISRKVDSKEKTIHATRYNKWEAVARPILFGSLAYTNVNSILREGSIPKIGSDLEKAILAKIAKGQTLLGSMVRHSGDCAVSYRNAGGRYYKIVLNFEPVFRVNGNETASSTYCKLTFPTITERDLACAIMNSGLFYWYWVVFSDNWHMIGREINSFPVMAADEGTKKGLVTLCSKLIDDLRKHSVDRCEYRNKGKDIVEFQQFVARHSKGIIDGIDHILAKLYSLTEDEKDFIVNYDIKYRMGVGSKVEDE